MAIADRPASETTGTDLPDLLARFVERASRWACGWDGWRMRRRRRGSRRWRGSSARRGRWWRRSWWRRRRGWSAATRDAPFGVSLARLAVAETASVLLAEPTLEDRAVGMLTVARLVLCRTAELVPSLDEAAPVLREIALRPGGGYATLVTGPSRTADIERMLTVGVQGPARVDVLFVDDLYWGRCLPHPSPGGRQLWSPTPVTGLWPVGVGSGAPTVCAVRRPALGS